MPRSTNYPAGQNSIERVTKKMKFHNMFSSFSKKTGDSTSVRREKVEVRDSNTGKLYGVRTIMQKTTETEMAPMSLLQELTEKSDYSALPDKVIGDIQKLIRKGAVDVAQDWKDAMELVDTAYHVAGAKKPTPDQRSAWKQYEDMLRVAVRQLSKVHGVEGKWRSTRSNATDVMEATSHEPVDPQKEMGNISSKRFFVEIPGSSNAEIAAKSIDEIIDTLTNKLRRHGAKARVDQRSDDLAVVSVWVNEVKREEIVIKQVGK